MKSRRRFSTKATQVGTVTLLILARIKNAVKLDRVSYQEIVSKNLGIMDTSAVSLCRDKNLPILVFDLKKPGNILKAVMGEKVGTLVDTDGGNS